MLDRARRLLRGADANFIAMIDCRPNRNNCGRYKGWRCRIRLGVKERPNVGHNYNHRCYLSFTRLFVSMLSCVATQTKARTQCEFFEKISLALSLRLMNTPGGMSTRASMPAEFTKLGKAIVG